MHIEQLSVFLGNRKGSLREVTKVLTDNNINLTTMSIADTNDFGLLRIITDNNPKAFSVLKDAGFTVTVSELIGVEVGDTPGGLHGVLEILDGAGISIEYLYSYAHSAAQKAVILIRVKNRGEAVEVLRENGIKLIGN